MSRLPVSRLKAELTRAKAEVKSLKDELKQRELAQKRRGEKEAAELRAERQKADRLQAQLKKLEEDGKTQNPRAVLIVQSGDDDHGGDARVEFATKGS
ncbi:unnamed protein product [Symbiodinium necroappetens]|uniref:Uncharacterized protein n=1 Tax=Symbiodinium necroappetens TaxID=1628268 RepID=A0A812Z311_9DINO|nr:unnamed protein product [Symbiodinium necroappetens]